MSRNTSRSNINNDISGIDGFNPKKVNLIVAPKGSNLNIRTGPSTGTSILFTLENTATPPKVSSAGRTTGDYEKDGSYIWYKLITTNKRGVGWVRNDVIKLYKPGSTPKNIENEAQDVVNKLIASDLKVYGNLVKSGAILEDLTKEGKNVSKASKMYKPLLDRLTTRQEKLKTSKVLKVKTGALKAANWVKDAFKTYIFNAYHMRIGDTDQIGAIVSMIVGGAIVGGALAAAYFIFRADYDESSVDLKISNDLAELLAQADPETAQAIKDDLEKQLDRGARSGFVKGKFKGMFNIVKIAAFVGLGLWVSTKVMKRPKKKK